VFGVLVHGSETGPLPGALQTMGWLSSQNHLLPFQVTFFVGNGPAAWQGRRFIDDDLNGLFGADTSASPEFQRAQEVQNLLAKSHLFVDFHQTQAPSPHPFYVLGKHTPSWSWAQALALAPVAVMPGPRSPSQSTQKSRGTSAAQWCRRQGIPALLVEVSEQGISAQTSAQVFHMIATTLSVVAQWQNHPNPPLPSGPPLPLKRLSIAHTIALTNPGDRLLDGWVNFDPVAAGQQVGVNAQGFPIVTPIEGRLVFPIYPPRNKEGDITGGMPRRLGIVLTEGEQNDMFLLGF